VIEISDFAGGLRQMADNADRLSERHDVAEMAGLRRQLEEQAVKARRDADLIAELRRQARSMNRSLDGIGRLRRGVLNGDVDAVQILADALLVLDGPCENYTAGSCRHHPGRTRGASFTAEAWCGPCVARDALERAGLVGEDQR
jgi:hypothetical protein